jgi:polyhydroxybutyrate depolymerase
MPKQNQVVNSFLFGLLFSVNFADNNNPVINSTDSIIVGGIKRTWLMHIPLLHDITKQVPLLVVLHGGGGNGRSMVKLTSGEFDRISDKKDFIVVYPDGIGKHWNDGRKSEETGYSAHKENIDDVGFISAMIDHLIKKMNIDAKRVYVTGMSNGAIMSYRLACELSGKIAAIAPVAGNIPVNLLRTCSASKTVSVLAICNVNDPLVPFNGGDVTGPFGQKKLGKVLSSRESVKFWVNHNGCLKKPDITYEPHNDREDETRTRREVYSNGNNNTEVILYVIEGGGHTWPGGYQYLPEVIIGKTSRDLNAAEVIWNFFEKHTLM